MVGLDAAGKTTILYKLKLGEGEKTGKFYPTHARSMPQSSRKSLYETALSLCLTHFLSFLCLIL